MSSSAGLELEAAESTSTGGSGSGAGCPASWLPDTVSGVLRSSLFFSISHDALQLPELPLLCEVTGDDSSQTTKLEAWETCSLCTAVSQSSVGGWFALLSVLNSLPYQLLQQPARDPNGLSSVSALKAAVSGKSMNPRNLPAQVIFHPALQKVWANPEGGNEQ